MADIVLLFGWNESAENGECVLHCQKKTVRFSAKNVPPSGYCIFRRLADPDRKKRENLYQMSAQ